MAGTEYSLLIQPHRSSLSSSSSLHILLFTLSIPPICAWRAKNKTRRKKDEKVHQWKEPMMLNNYSQLFWATFIIYLFRLLTGISNKSTLHRGFVVGRRHDVSCVVIMDIKVCVADTLVWFGLRSSSSRLLVCAFHLHRMHASMNLNLETSFNEKNARQTIETKRLLNFMQGCVSACVKSIVH